MEAEHVRWVRYAADCLERVVGKMKGEEKTKTQNDIAGAREWADNPYSEVRRVERKTAPAARYVVGAMLCAIIAADKAIGLADNPKVERAWQARRRLRYGLKLPRATRPH